VANAKEGKTTPSEFMNLPDCDDYGTPKEKMPICPECGEDELVMIQPGEASCIACGLKVIDRQCCCGAQKGFRNHSIHCPANPDYSKL